MNHPTAARAVRAGAFGLLIAVSSAAQARSEKPIQDNSFLIEEAYNQEDGVVQHIFTYRRVPSTGMWQGTFTQEWPVEGVRHQLSYTIPAGAASGATGGGVEDAALNYRWQATGDGEARIAIAPRVSLLLPTGDRRRGLGSGAVSAQVNLPASIALSESFVAHANAGWTYVPRAENDRGDRAATSSINFGGSVVWIGGGKVNPLVEALWTSSQIVVGPGRTRREREILVSPGFRWAHDLAGSLQVVPGIGCPIEVGDGHARPSVFLYLSLEHPFRPARRAGAAP